jgi:hypothetical protein
MLFQGLARGFAQDAHAVDYANARQSGEKGAVDELFDFAGGVVDVAVEFYFLRRETKRRPDGAPFIFSILRNSNPASVEAETRSCC